MRPVLTPAVRRLWRGPSTLQLGRGTGRGAVLEGVDPALRAALGLLDGTRDRTQVLSAASAAGCPPDRADALLSLLGQAGLLDDAGTGSPAAHLLRGERERLVADVASLALVRGDGGLPALGHRTAARVLVVGAGRVGAPLATTLASAGVGSVDVLDEAPAAACDTGTGAAGLDDVGTSRGAVARRLLREAAPSAGCAPLRGADVVVLAPARPDQLDDGRALLPGGVPHLLAEVRDTVGVVGPLVLPGRTACLHCLDLTRTDLDPGWPAVAAQLVRPEGRTACDGPLALAVAATAALQVLALLDGTADPAAAGGTLELALPDWRWRRRSWPAHPDCDCGAATGPAARWGGAAG